MPGLSPDRAMNRLMALLLMACCVFGLCTVPAKWGQLWVMVCDGVVPPVVLLVCLCTLGAFDEVSGLLSSSDAHSSEQQQPQT